MSINIRQSHSGRKTIAVLIMMMFLTLFILPAEAGDPKINNIKKFYQNNCVKCHGADGSAAGEDGRKLKGEDFTDQEWQQDTRDDKMIRIIMDGKFFGLAMPAYKDKLTREEAQLMVTEIIRKSKRGKIIEPDVE
jgi:mono/diheme cytochrome c family protein